MYRFSVVNPGLLSFRLTCMLQILQGFNHTQYAYKFLGAESLHDSLSNFEVTCTLAKV